MSTLTRKSNYLDNSTISTYKECPRKYLLRHHLGWSVDYAGKAPALVFGSSWHAGMDAIWGAGPDVTLPVRTDLAMYSFQQQWEEDGFTFQLSMEEQDTLGARTPGVAHEMFYNYIQAREVMLKEATVLSIEAPVAMPLPELEDTWYIGKLDKVIEWNGVHILEHKTTSAYAIKGMFQPDWVESWGTSPQVKGYQLIGTMNYPNLQDVWVDGALVHKKVHDAFKLIPISHAWPLLEEWIADTRQWIIEIQKEEYQLAKQGELSAGMFRKNEDQCFGKYSKCPFLAICSVCTNPLALDGPPMGYKVERWEPFEILKLDQLLTTKE